MQPQKDLGSFPRQTIQHQSNSAYGLTANTEDSEVFWVYEDLQDSLELTPPCPPTHPPQKKKKEKKWPFHHWGLECKSRNSRDTWKACLALEYKMKQGEV